MNEYAAVILVTPQGHIAVQLRDNKPDIPEPGQLMVFAGRLHDGEPPEDAARRELAEETTLQPRRLEFLTTIPKTPGRHGETGQVHVYVARDIDVALIHIREGQGYRLIHGPEDLAQPECSVITADILHAYYARQA